MEQQPRNILAFDVETTGLNKELDEVIELAILAIKGDDQKTLVYRFRPTVAIHRKAQETHGISAEELSGEPLFRDRAAGLHKLFSNAEVFVGYNVQFDVDFMRSMFSRHGLDDPFYGKPFLDPLRIWMHEQPRTLGAAYERFCGVVLEDAHEALADINATVEVLEAILNEFAVVPTPTARAWHLAAPFDDLDATYFPEKRIQIGPTHHFKWDDGRVVFNFSQNYRDTALYELEHDGYKFCEWLLKKDFPPHVKDIVREFFVGLKEEEFNRVISERYGAPPVETDEE